MRAAVAQENPGKKRARAHSRDRIPRPCLESAYTRESLYGDDGDSAIYGKSARSQSQPRKRV